MDSWDAIGTQTCNASSTGQHKRSRIAFARRPRVLPRLQFVEKVRQRNGSNVVRHIERVLARMNNE